MPVCNSVLSVTTKLLLSRCPPPPPPPPPMGEGGGGGHIFVFVGHLSLPRGCVGLLLWGGGDLFLFLWVISPCLEGVWGCCYGNSATCYFTRISVL